jgi:hypothetical protein
VGAQSENRVINKAHRGAWRLRAPTRDRTSQEITWRHDFAVFHTYLEELLNRRDPSDQLGALILQAIPGMTRFMRLSPSNIAGGRVAISATLEREFQRANAWSYFRQLQLPHNHSPSQNIGLSPMIQRLFALFKRPAEAIALDYWAQETDTKSELQFTQVRLSQKCFAFGAPSSTIILKEAF